MSEVSDRYRSIATAFAARLAGIGSEQWDTSTPCTDWTVRDLVEHTVATQARVLANGTGETAPPVDGGSDLGAPFEATSAAMIEALADPEVAGKTVGGMFGDQPFERLVSGLGCADLLLHTWDLSRATGQDENLDERACAVALEFLTPMDEPIRRPGGFSAKLPVADDATVQARLLAFCGRAG